MFASFNALTAASWPISTRNHTNIFKMRTFYDDLISAKKIHMKAIYKKAIKIS